MIRPLLIGAGLIGLGACAASDADTVSSINYLQEPISATCARDALVQTEGFAVATAIGRNGSAREINATFNSDLAVTVLVRTDREGDGEVSAFVRLSPDSTPFDRREAQFAVRAADEAIYRSCTEDGQTYYDDGDVVIEATE